MKTEPLIALEHVSVTFRSAAGPVAALQDVSMHLQAGERIGLVGESGSGKTTLARVLLGLQKPDQGSVKVGGVNPYALPAAGRKTFRRTIQLVFQDPYGSLNPRLTVEQALAEVLCVHGLAAPAERSARVAGLLQQVGLNPELAPRYPHEFSGGQRQRIALARALAVEPRVLVADEPVSALDVSVQVQILNLLADLQRQRGLALLLIAHDLAVVRYCCDRVMVMHEGRVVEQGLASDVLDHPQHPYTARLLAAVPDLEAALAAGATP